MQKGLGGNIEFLANPTVGEVRVASGDTLAAGLMSAVIDRLSRRFPDIVVRVIQANAETLDFRELRERKVDLALARISRTFVEDDLDVEILSLAVMVSAILMGHYANEYADVDTDSLTKRTLYSGGSGVLPSGIVP